MAINKMIKGKKKWVKIVAPELFNKVEIGESYVVNANQLIGRMFSTSLSEIINDIKKQHISIKFKVEKAEGEKAITSIYAFVVSSAYIKRFVRRGKDKIDDSFVCTSSDGKRLRVKTSTVTKGLVKKSICTRIRRGIRTYLIKRFAEKPFEAIVKDVVDYRYQTSMKNEVKRVYPVKVCEIRYVGLEERAGEHRKRKEAKEVIEESEEQEAEEAEAQESGKSKNGESKKAEATLKQSKEDKAK